MLLVIYFRLFDHSFMSGQISQFGHSVMSLPQWCTILFCKGLNKKGFLKSFAKQTSATTQIMSNKCMHKSTNMTCTVTRKANIKSYREMHS